MAHLICSKLINTEILNFYTSATCTCSNRYFKELPFANLRGINQANEKDETSLQTAHSSNHSMKLKEY